MDESKVHFFISSPSLMSSVGKQENYTIQNQNELKENVIVLLVLKHTNLEMNPVLLSLAFLLLVMNCAQHVIIAKLLSFTYLQFAGSAALQCTSTGASTTNTMKMCPFNSITFTLQYCRMLLLLLTLVLV